MGLTFDLRAEHLVPLSLAIKVPPSGISNYYRNRKFDSDLTLNFLTYLRHFGSYILTLISRFKDGIVIHTIQYLN